MADLWNQRKPVAHIQGSKPLVGHQVNGHMLMSFSDFADENVGNVATSTMPVGCTGGGSSPSVPTDLHG